VAGASGLPMGILRGYAGTGLVEVNDSVASVECPFTGEQLVAVPPLAPDVALLHAPMGDRHGNLHLDQPFVLDERFAAASGMVLATVDRLVSTEEVAAAGVVIPAHAVAAVAEIPFGAHPSSCYPSYGYDRPHLASYIAAASAGGAAIATYLERYVHAGEKAYRLDVDADRLVGWSLSVQNWQELFS
ncbi:MAG: glutaconate CoA-transferase, subunit, partial [Pseudonocardiales bacterium]|nr:glutaconate CoA-transferase, subunit [Pseudonocardiales bacterium]